MLEVYRSASEFQERFGVKFIEGYGLTETGMATYMDPTRPAVPGSMGKANPGYEVQIVEPGTDRPLSPGTPGEIVVDMKIPNIVMRAYYGMPEKTAEDFRNLKLHTGDLGRMDEEGYVYFMDRVKDYIRRRGENVSSMEVEKIVGDHPAIREASVLGIPDAHWGEAVVAAIVRREGVALTADEVIEYVRGHLASYKKPRHVCFLPALPRTPASQQVHKPLLKELILQQIEP